MATVLDRLALGAAVLLGRLVTRTAGEVDLRLRLQALEQSAVAATAAPTAAPVAAPTVAPTPARPLTSMPLPTGYGLQVVGPEGEELLVPVCLPAGFELDSLVLRPAFLPVEDGATPAAVAPATTVAAPPAAARPAEAAPPRERLGQAMQLVYGADAPYRAQIDGAGPTGAAPSVDLGGLRPVQRSEATAPHADVVATAGR